MNGLRYYVPFDLNELQTGLKLDSFSPVEDFKALLSGVFMTFVMTFMTFISIINSFVHNCSTNRL